MRADKVPNWISPTIIGILIFAGVGSLVVWMAEKDKAFIPLAAALVSGTATLIGVAIGVMVLRFNYRSQVNPLRLELYKKRMEAMIELYQSLYPLRFLYTYHVHFGETFTVDKELESLTARHHARFKKARKKSDLLAPNDVLRHAVKVATAAVNHAQTLIRIHALGKKPSDSTRLSGFYSEMADSWTEFTNRCRKHIGTKELSDGIIELLGVDIEEESMREKRFRKMMDLELGRMNASILLEHTNEQSEDDPSGGLSLNRND